MTTGDLLGYLGMLLGGATPWLEAVVVVPAGVVAGLAVLPATVLAVAGNLATVVLAAVWGERLNGWWRRRRRTRVPATAGAGWAGGGDRGDAGGDADAAAEGDEARDDAGTARRGVAAGPPRQGRAARLWRRYGLVGLAVLAPIVTGTQLAALVAVTAGAPRTATVWWVAAGTAAWAVVAAAATVAGVELVVG